MDGLKARVDVSRKSQRAREKDLEDNRVKQQKYEGQLYQVKTNKEYSAVLVEIGEVKQEKSRIEEDILGLMESQERIAAELKDVEGDWKGRESEGKSEEATLVERLRGVEAELAVVRSEAGRPGSAAPAQGARRLRQDPAASGRRRRGGDQAQLLRRLPRDHHAPAPPGAAPAERPDPLRVLRSVSLLDRRLSSRRAPRSPSPGTVRDVSMTAADRPVTIYSDGACSGNPGPGGWAAVVIDGEEERELSGAEARTTNQRMEIRGALEGLRSLDSARRVGVYSDSAYVVNCFRDKWYERWLRNGWKSSQKKPVENRDLWEALIAEAGRHQVTWHKVAGHSGDPLNDRADRLAVAAIAQLRART